MTASGQETLRAIKMAKGGTYFRLSDNNGLTNFHVELQAAWVITATQEKKKLFEQLFRRVVTLPLSVALLVKIEW